MSKTNELNHLKAQQRANMIEAKLQVAKAAVQGQEAYVYEIRAWDHDISYVLPFRRVFTFMKAIIDPYTELGFSFASNWELCLLASTD